MGKMSELFYDEQQRREKLDSPLPLRKTERPCAGEVRDDGVFLLRYDGRQWIRETE